MNSSLFAQEAVDVNNLLATMRKSDPATLERVLIFGAIGLVTLLVVLWAVFLRKRRRRRRSHHHGSEHSLQPAETLVAPNPAADPSPPAQRRHRRRSGRKHRRLNPTLAETGGLPPVRPEDSPPPQP